MFGNATGLELLYDGTSEYDVAVGDDALYVDNSAGNIGIGDTTPDAALDIELSRTAAGLVRLQNTSSTGYSTIDFFNESGTKIGGIGNGNSAVTGAQNQNTLFLQADGTGDLWLGASGTEAIFIEGTNANVGIGTLIPTEELHVVGDARVTGLASCATIQSSATGVLSCGGSGSSLFTDAGTFTHLTSTTDDLVVGASTTAASTLFVDVSEDVVSINTNATSFSVGTSGYGTQYPSLIVDERTTGGTDTIIALNNDHTADYLDNGLWGFKSDAGGKTPDNTELLSINGFAHDGTDYGLAAGILFKVDGDVATAGDTSDTPGKIAFRTAGDGFDNHREVLLLRSNGDVEVKFYAAATGTSVCRDTSTGALAQCTSLAAYKENISDLSLGLDAINALTPRKFDWKANGEADLGFIAEEVQAVNPLFAQYEGNGDLSGVKYEQLSALAIAGIQELDDKLEATQLTVSSNTSRITALEAAVFDSTFTSLTVNGSAIVTDLTVTGTATIANLTVTDTITVDNIATNTLSVNTLTTGRIITDGDVPEALAETAAGLGAVVTVEGNDTSGTVTIATGSQDVLIGELATIEFNAEYEDTPRIILSPVNADAVGAPVFIDLTKVSETEFVLDALGVLDLDTTYQFNYFIVE